MTAFAALAGATAGVGLVLIIAAFVTEGPRRSRADWLRRRLSGVSGRRVTASIAIPLLVGAVTGWPVAGGLALVAVLLVPRVWDVHRVSTRRIVRLEALAGWTRRLADLLSAGAGLEQALAASLRAAPPAIADDVARLGWRLRTTGSTQAALRDFAADLADPTGDLVVAALLLACERRGRGLAGTLTALASTVDAEVVMRRQVEADRAGPRTTVRWVMLITLTAVGALVLFDRTYLQPFATPLGQVTLAVTGGLFALAFAWMQRLTADGDCARFIHARAEEAL